jgi:hypothetical protein
MGDSLGRVVMLVVVAAGIWWAATTFLVHQTPGGLSKATSTVSQAAAAHGLPSGDVRCGKSAQPPSSIGYVNRVVLPQTSDVTLYSCVSPAAANVGGSQSWCVVGTPGSNPWFAMNEDCLRWAQSGQ